MCRKKILFLLQLILLAIVLTASFSCTSKKKEHQVRRDIATIVIEAVEVVIDNKNARKIALYFSPNYLEYHGEAPVNYEEFTQFILNTNSIVPQRTIYRSAVDGNIVALHSQVLYENLAYSTIDFFEVDDNLIVSRYSFSQEDDASEVFSTTTIASNTTPTSTSLWTTQMYKQQVELLYNDIFPNAKKEEVDNIFAYNFTTHRSDISSGRQGIIDLLSLGPIIYNIKLIVVENNIAFIYLEEENTSTAYAEILSFATDGLILESWAIPLTMVKQE